MFIRFELIGITRHKPATAPGKMMKQVREGTANQGLLPVKCKIETGE
jgi:hypothetical protein